MRVCVTGGNSMIANNLKDVLSSSSPTFATTMVSPFHFTYLTREDVDLRDREKTFAFFRKHKYDALIHLAANVGGLYKNQSSNIAMFRDNMMMNQNVIDACHETGINKAIFCLSSCIYPCSPEYFPMTEELLHSGKPHPSNEGYAYSKRMLEMLCRQYNETYNRKYICVTPVNMYGKYDNFNLNDGHFIPMIIHRFHCTGRYMAYGTGNPLRQFLYAADFARFLVTVLTSQDETLDQIITGGSPNIICCGDDEYTIRDTVLHIMDSMELDKTGLTWDSTRGDGCMRKTVSNAKLKSLYPEFEFTSLEDGLGETVEWFYENYPNVRN